MLVRRGFIERRLIIVEFDHLRIKLEDVFLEPEGRLTEWFGLF